jgi:hypothetical protein
VHNSASRVDQGLTLLNFYHHGYATVGRGEVCRSIVNPRHQSLITDRHLVRVARTPDHKGGEPLRRVVRERSRRRQLQKLSQCNVGFRGHHIQRYQHGTRHRQLACPGYPSSVAVIVVVPMATEVANPSLPATLLLGAAPGVPVLQVTSMVRSCVVPSENVPVAVICCDVPSAMPGS